MKQHSIRTIALAGLAMAAFAANSVLCRAALSQAAIDPATFTLVRLASGSCVLCLILSLRRKREQPGGSWPASLALFVYAAAFSFAYISLPAGIGSLLLFGAVQTTMVGYGLVRGERLSALQWFGLTIAVAGVGALVAPGALAPSVTGACLMLTAGVHGALTPCSAVALRIPSAQPPAISCVPYQSQFVFLCALCCSAQISPLTGSLVRSFLA